MLPFFSLPFVGVFQWSLTVSQARHQRRRCGRLAPGHEGNGISVGIPDGPDGVADRGTPGPPGANRGPSRLTPGILFPLRWHRRLSPYPDKLHPAPKIPFVRT